MVAAANVMPGAGKYDELCTYVRTQASAKSVVLLIVGGNKGDGFSVQANPEDILGIPEFLRTLATGIQAQMESHPGGAAGYIAALLGAEQCKTPSAS